MANTLSYSRLLPADQESLYARICAAQLAYFRQYSPKIRDLAEGMQITGGVLLPAAVLRKFGLRKPLKNNGANQTQARWMADYQSALVRLERKAGCTAE